jgi:hypothetical protein
MKLINHILYGVLATLLITTSAQAAIFGVSLNGHHSTNVGPSSLYSIDSVTGAGTLVGTNLGHAVNSIAIDPTTGIMYGTTTNWSGTNSSLLKIDPVTGTSTVVGSCGLFLGCRTLTSDSVGNLWGWTESGDDAVTINKSTGTATVAGESGVFTAGQVLAFDASDNLTLVQHANNYTINQGTGAAVLGSTLSFDPGSGGAAFDFSTGLLWAALTTGKTQDSKIRVTDLAGNSFTDLDTDVEYLHALTIGSISAVPIPAAVWLFGTALIGLVGFGKRKARIAA